MSHYVVPREKSTPCDAVFCQNSLTICLFFFQICYLTTLVAILSSQSVVFASGQLLPNEMNFDLHSASYRVPMQPRKSLKVLEFFSSKFKALKVLEKKTGA